MRSGPVEDDFGGLDTWIAKAREFAAKYPKTRAYDPTAELYEKARRLADACARAQNHRLIRQVWAETRRPARRRKALIE